MGSQGERTRERLQEAIKRELSLILEFEARDPRLRMVNVTAVRLSRDLKRATVLLDLGDANHQEVLELCERDRGFFRSELAKRLDLRRTPELHFKLDEDLQRARRIDELLRRERDQDQDLNWDWDRNRNQGQV